MTTDPSLPIASLRAHLGARSLGRPGAAALARLTEAGVPTTGCDDPLAVALASRDHAGSVPACVRAEALLRIAAVDEMAALCLLVALEPALTSMAKRLARSGIARPDAEVRVLAACWSTLTEPPRAGSGALSSVLSRTWSRIRTELRRERSQREVLLAHANQDAPDLIGPIEAARLLIDEARAAGVVSGTEADLVYATRVLGVPVALAGRRAGRSRAGTWKARRRAEAALRSYLTEGSR